MQHTNCQVYVPGFFFISCSSSEVSAPNSSEETDSLAHAEPKINVFPRRVQTQRAGSRFISIIILNKISWLLYVKTCLLKEPMLRLSHYLISLILEPMSNKCSITLLLLYFNLLRIGIEEESSSKLIFLKEQVREKEFILYQPCLGL